MRIASSGRNPSEKEMVSDQNDMGSIENKSFDPDHEPRKEGTVKMKGSPSIGEIHTEGMSEVNSIGAIDRGKQRGSQSRSPGRVVAHITDADDDSNANYRSLNSDNKNINRNSNRKIKPI